MERSETPTASAGPAVDALEAMRGPSHASRLGGATRTPTYADGQSCVRSGHEPRRSRPGDDGPGTQRDRHTPATQPHFSAGGASYSSLQPIWFTASAGVRDLDVHDAAS